MTQIAKVVWSEWANDVHNAVSETGGILLGTARRVENEWHWEARTQPRTRPTGKDLHNGIALTLEGAKRIIETLLVETGTAYAADLADTGIPVIPPGYQLVPTVMTTDIAEAMGSVPERPVAGYWAKVWTAAMNAVRNVKAAS